MPKRESKDVLFSTNTCDDDGPELLAEEITLPTSPTKSTPSDPNEPCKSSETAMSEGERNISKKQMPKRESKDVLFSTDTLDDDGPELLAEEITLPTSPTKSTPSDPNEPGKSSET